jgi:methionyl-tRNA formyltransferase
VRGRTPAEPSTAVRAVFFGSGRFAVPVLDALVSVPRLTVVAVVSAPDRPFGRKAVVTPTPVSARAREVGLPLLQPARVRAPEAIEAVRALAPDLAVLADFGQLIPRALLDLPRRGFLNLHPSALPRHRGAAPIAATILAGDRESAVSLICLTEEMDAGPIVATERLAVRPDDTAATLEDRAAQGAARLVARALPGWLAGRLEARPQPSDGVTVTRPLRREDGRLDATKPAGQLERQVRAYQPWPGSYLETAEGRLIVWRARVTKAEAADSPGRLVFADGGLALTTARGRLLLQEVQLAGSHRMPSADLLRGHPRLIGLA